MELTAYGSHLGEAIRTPQTLRQKECLSSEIRHLILEPPTYEKPGANIVSVSALKGYKESFVCEIIMGKNSTAVKYARDDSHYLLILVILAATKGDQRGRNTLLKGHKRFAGR